MLFNRSLPAPARPSSITKLADNTTVVGLITDNDREEVRELAVWCQDNNLSLNVRKTKELIVDYRYRLIGI